MRCGPLTLYTVLVLHFGRDSRFVRALCLPLSLCLLDMSGTVSGHLSGVRSSERSPCFVAKFVCSLPVHVRPREPRQSKLSHRLAKCPSLHRGECPSFGLTHAGILLRLLCCHRVHERPLRCTEVLFGSTACRCPLLRPRLLNFVLSHHYNIRLTTILTPWMSDSCDETRL